jgi:hypothetical protein
VDSIGGHFKWAGASDESSTLPETQGYFDVSCKFCVCGGVGRVGLTFEPYVSLGLCQTTRFRIFSAFPDVPFVTIVKQIYLWSAVYDLPQNGHRSGPVTTLVHLKERLKLSCETQSRFPAKRNRSPLIAFWLLKGEIACTRIMGGPLSSISTYPMNVRGSRFSSSCND